MKISYCITELRKARRMTQKELSNRSGVSTAMISFIENGKRHPTLEILLALCKALEVKVKEIINVGDQYAFF